MSLYTDFQQFVNDMEASSTFKSWCSLHAADCSSWKTYRAAVLSTSPAPAAPTLTTSFGRSLVDVAVMALHEGLVPPPPPPPPVPLTAGFRFTLDALTATFTNISTPGPSGAITGWHWDFGDGNTSNVQNPPPHAYASPGTYSVVLTVTSADGTASVTHPVTVASAPVASFTYATTGLAVVFSDTSTPGASGTITGWHWDFGDGNTSSLQNPPHTYASAATRTVTLTVTGGGGDGTDSTSLPVTVSATPPPITGVTPGIGVLVYNHLSGLGTNVSKYATLIGTVSDVPTLVTAKGKALIYMAAEDVAADTSTNYGVTYDQALAGGWLLKDSSGNLLHNKSYPSYIGDVGAAGYQNQWITHVLAYIAAHPGLDGVFIDDVTYDPRAICGTFPAKYPNTAAWAAAMTAFCTAVHNALSSHGYYVALNASGYISGDSRYTDGTLDLNWFNALGPHADGLMNEFYCEGNATLSPRRTGAEWYNNWEGWQRLIPAAQSHAADFIGLMKGEIGTTATPANEMYGKASFLMEWDGGGGVFMYGIARSSADPTNAAWTTDIGLPTAAKVAVGVGWKRTYSKGIAIINTSKATSQVFSLGGTYHEPNGTPVSSVTLAAGTAMILTV